MTVNVQFRFRNGLPSMAQGPSSRQLRRAGPPLDRLGIDAPFDDGYWLRSERLGGMAFGRRSSIPTPAKYGGWNIGNRGEKIRATAGALNAVLPASGVLVFRRL
ncbi:hypothetical protein [Rhizobium ecuadorense]|uniref:hypothetical protein n=1 Tax=Rhizobium ecuadorense TaxID=1671795 RepID=UPI001FCE250C|nr:hypothetical protein [Rhizobium ecuadorense]